MKNHILGAAILLSACTSPQNASPPDFADLVEAVSPSVVNISTEAGATPRDERAQGVPDRGAMDEFLRRFLERGMPENEEEAPADEEAEIGPGEQMESLGSGFVLWEDGYILTNAHVVKDAKKILVRLTDRRELPATLVGLDERSDLALLKIEASGLPAVKIGDVAKLRPGQWVLAIGSPFGFDYSVTAGIVSAKGRALPSENYVPFIQTDVPINPGNSGGPLFNTRGEVVGVNSQIFSQTGGYMGVSFSIPIDVAAKVARQIKDEGGVTRGWLGVVVQEVTRELAKNFGMDRAEGALVARVLPGSPAEKAGIKAGDVIVTYNDQPLPRSSALPPLVGANDPGDTVTLKLIRDGKTLTVKAEIAVLEGSGKPPLKSRLGIKVKSLTTEQRGREQVASGGVRVVEVNPGPGREAGLRVGDIILTFGGKEVDTAQKLEEIASQLNPGKAVPMLVQREGTPLFLALEMPAP
ncbi:MAG: DegQ family serine endoprotease [Pseudomonadota bacterium]